MHRVEVDDEVFAMLQREAEPFVDTPNDVLRRKLIGAASGTSAPIRRGTGDLIALLKAGMISPGDELEYRQPRKGRVHRAHVLPDGWVDVDGEPYKKMSPSLKACVGTEINGWFWLHVPTNKRLRQLRHELASREAHEVPTLRASGGVDTVSRRLVNLHGNEP